MMLACLRRPQRTQAADAHDARLPAPAEVHNARFGGLALKGHRRLMLMMLACPRRP